MTQESRSTVALDDLLSFIREVVEQHFAGTKLPVNGAWLAEKIRHHFPGLRFEDLGLEVPKLSAAISVGESRGFFVRNRSVPHLEVFPASQSNKSLVDSPILTTAAQIYVREGAVHIRPDIWRAFVFVDQGQRNWWDRTTGQVVVRANGTESTEDRDRMVEIPPITLAEQQEWMREFLLTHANLSTDGAPIEDPRCFLTFPTWLGTKGDGLDRQWKRFRVDHVADKIRAWATANAIDARPFFAVPLSPASRGVAPHETTSAELAIVRRAISLAVNELSLEELQDFSIPIRFVLQAMKRS